MLRSDMRYGIVVIDTRLRDDGGDGIVHFCGYPQLPEPCHFDELKDEICNNSDFGLSHSSQFLIYELASPETVEFFKNLLSSADIFNS